MYNLFVFVIKFLILLYSFNVFADSKPEFNLGGKFYFNIAIPEFSSDYSNGGFPHDENYKNHIDGDSNLVSDNYLDFLLIDKNDTGLLYGARVGVMAESSLQSYYQYDDNVNIINNSKQESLIVRRAYIFTERSNIGRFELGDVDSASKKLKFDASYRFGGTGGIAGKWWKYVNIPDFGLQYDAKKLDGADDCSNYYAQNDVRNCSGKGNMGFLIRPDLPISHGYSEVTGADKFDDTRTLLRFSFYTPRIYGFQYGFSYALDSGNRGSSYYDNANELFYNNDVENIYDFGLNYVEQFGKLGIAFSLTSERAKIVNVTSGTNNSILRKDLSAYSLGSYIFYGNFSISGSYGIWGDSLMMVNDSIYENDVNYRDSNADYYTLGIGYQFGPYKIGLSNLTSQYREQEFLLYSLAIDYNLSKYFSLFGELNMFDFNSIDHINTQTIDHFKTKNNKGEVLLIGAKIKFGDYDSASQLLLDTSLTTY